jgi:pantoate--beta-alanine ligase
MFLGTHMKIIHTITDLKKLLQPHRQKGKTIGFVPTMGALHEGHATLVRRCVEENELCVVSIFVNPTQFNNQEDLRLYPRTPEKDYALLERTGVDIVFAPSVEEMYPEPDTRIFDFGLLDKVMEGAFRPGHFNGVAQVVSKLFTSVEPHKAYFGEKDFQQLAIVREMVKQLALPVEIVGVPIVREQDGLAMSSRNQRLSVSQREHAPEICRVLRESTLLTGEQSPDQLVRFVTGTINNVPDLHVEYFGIVDGDSLQPVSTWQDSESIIGAIAVYCGDVRLIDNIRYR